MTRSHSLQALPQLTTRSFLDPPARIAIAGDWHADTDYGVMAIDHAARRDATVLLHLGDFGCPARLWHGHFHHRYQSMLHGDGYRTVVDGLGKNGAPIDNNMAVVKLADLGFHRLSSEASTQTPCSA